MKQLIDNSHRIGWLDISKGIGIILVVYGHVVHDIGIDQATTTGKILSASDLFIYSFHMPLFFFIAGCLLKKQIGKKSIYYILINKLSTLLYPYIIWSLIQGCVEMYMFRHSATPVTLHEIGSLFWAPRAHFWFLYILFFMAVLTTVLEKVVRRYSLLLQYLICFFFVIFPIPLAGFSVFYIYFVVGFCLSDFFLKWTPKVNAKQVCLGFSILLLYEFLLLSNLEYSYKLQYILAPAGIFSVFLLSHYLNNNISKTKGNSLLVRYLSFLGTHSLVIYLSHVLVYKALFVVLGSVGIGNKLTLLFSGSLIGFILPPYLYKHAKHLKSGCLFDGRELMKCIRK